MFELNTLLTGLIIFALRIVDVSLGTIRIIVTVQGRSVIAFFLGICELMIWITVASTVINQMKDQPLLAFFYAFGYATGNVVGIKLERKLALGFIILRVITRTAGKSLTDAIRAMGQPVTVFRGEGMRGPVDELYIACRRRDLKRILSAVEKADPHAFYITEMARDVSGRVRFPYLTLNDRRFGIKRK